jgi:MFS family permease
MPPRLAVKLGEGWSTALAATFLVANAFVWYLGAFKFLQEGFENTQLLGVICVNIVSLTVTALLVTLLIRHFKQRLRFLKYWVIAGVVFSASYLALNLNNFYVCLVASGVLGVYFGLGMPVCMGYFAAATKPELRGKCAAIVILLIGIGFPLVTSIDYTQTFLIAGVLALWRILPLASIYLYRPPEMVAEPSRTPSYRAVGKNKAFLLYLVPWFMFVLINDLAMNINAGYFKIHFPVLYGNYLIVELVLSGFSAVVCGVLADKKGRKWIALIGFALLGLGYATLGIFDNSIYAVYSAWFYVFADGISWGAFSMLFLVTIWGDLSLNNNSEKYYFLGVVPYLISNVLGAYAGSIVAGALKGEGVIFSFASFFLFVAILPLAYAPETLADKIIKDLELNDYITKAMQKVNKEKTHSDLK